MMICPSCLQEIPGQPDRCPFCKISLIDPNGYKVASVKPPRAKDRGARADFVYRVSLAANEAHTMLDELVEKIRSFVPKPLRNIPHSELWLSLILPGLGHFSIGWYKLGFVVFCIFLTMLIMLIFMAIEPYQVDLSTYLFLLGFLLAVAHVQVVWAANRKYPMRSAWPGWVLSVIIILGMGVQMRLVGLMIWRSQYRLQTRYIQLTGDRGFYKPHFLRGDILDISPVTPRDIGLGDIVMIDQLTLERVLGVEGDKLVLNDGVILRNGLPLSPQQQPLIAYGSIHDLPFQIRDSLQNLPRNQNITVSSGQIGLLYWGRQLKAIPISNITGRVDGIIAPRERACRFVHGIRMPR